MRLTLTIDLHDLSKLVLSDENHAEILENIHTQLVERFTNDIQVIDSFCEERLELGETYELRLDELRKVWRRYIDQDGVIALYDWWAKELCEIIIGKYKLETNNTEDVMRFRVLGVRIIPEYNPYYR